MNTLTVLWRKLSSLSLSVRLLVISSMLMVINTLLANRYARTYHNLNTTPIWTWMDRMRHENLLIFLAVGSLIIVLALLALNTFACTLTRLAELSRRGKHRRGMRQTLVHWAPTLTHILFFLIMAGHMATFTFGHWQTHMVRRGNPLTYSPEFPPLRIIAFSRKIRNTPGVLQGGTIAHTVEMLVNGRSATISERKPLKLPNGDWLLLQAPKRKRRGSGAAEAPVDCSLEERHVKPAAFTPDQPIMLKQVSDPGVYFLFTGFGLIMLLLTGYYILSWRHRDRSAQEIGKAISREDRQGSPAT